MTAMNDPSDSSSTMDFEASSSSSTGGLTPSSDNDATAEVENQHSGDENVDEMELGSELSASDYRSFTGGRPDVQLVVRTTDNRVLEALKEGARNSASCFHVYSSDGDTFIIVEHGAGHDAFLVDAAVLARNSTVLQTRLDEA
jgi:hypothetical protein